ncbi:MAG: hypothetical protein L7F78_12830 [Syntrophales bacterium LBB04]|nr:hypothetical protein [Syntrophales bacterium LBB04]
MQGGQKQVTDVIAELTAEISELKRELLTNKIVKQSHEKYALKFGSLALGLVFYGLASAVPIAVVGGVAALLSSISHLHDDAKETEEKEAKIITSPAYALLKARELLSCQERE